MIGTAAKVGQSRIVNTAHLHATLTMMPLRQLWGRPGFQPNPTVKTEKNYSFCAHCTSASPCRQREKKRAKGMAPLTRPSKIGGLQVNTVYGEYVRAPGRPE